MAKLCAALSAAVTSRYNVDLRRVYLTGMSNGAFFRHLVASARPDSVAVIATHSGGLGFLAFKSRRIEQKHASFLSRMAIRSQCEVSRSLPGA
jgi:poly(3-hydroxybutyrate) depolymerase